MHRVWYTSRWTGWLFLSLSLSFSSCTRTLFGFFHPSLAMSLFFLSPINPLVCPVHVKWNYDSNAKKCKCIPTGQEFLHSLVHNKHEREMGERQRIYVYTKYTYVHKLRETDCVTNHAYHLVTCHVSSFSPVVLRRRFVHEEKRDSDLGHACRHAHAKTAQSNDRRVPCGCHRCCCCYYCCCKTKTR